MKTKIAAIAVLLLAGSAPAALAQDHGDHHQERPDQRGGERTPHDVGGRPAEQRMIHAQPQPQPAPQAQPQRGGERWRGGGGAPGGDRPGGWRHGGPNNFNGGGAPPPQPQAPAQPQHDWRGGDHRGDHGDRGGDHRPQVDSWGGDHRTRDGGDHNGYRGGDRGGEPGQWSGDHRQWNGDHRGDRGGDRNGWRGDHRAPPSGNHARWSPGRYPHAYHSSHRYHWRSYRTPPGFYVHSWAYGEILPQAWFSPDYVIEDWWDFGLPEPPYGYDWVRVGDDALLIYEGSGEVVQVVRDLFW